MHRRLGRTAAVCAAALVITACGGSDNDSEPAAEPAEAEPAEADEAETVDETETEEAPEPEPADDATDSDDASDSSGSFEPGSLSFRAVNMLDEPVDLYVRTSGLVEAFLVRDDLAPGEVSEFHAPPEDGVFLVTEADATDPTCVSSCDQFIAELGRFIDDGPTRTVLLYPGDEFDPTKAFELWEEPTTEPGTNTSRMVDPDPASAIAVVTGAAITGADFGLRVSVEGVAGCIEPINLAGILVGGTQTPAYALDSAGSALTLHDQPDTECSEPAVGGPFTIDGGPGTRTHVFLKGEPGSLDAILLPMVGDVPADPTASADDAGNSDGSSGDDALAIELMTEEVIGEFGIPADQAACVSELLVDRIGADILVVDGQLVDLDSFDDDVNETAGMALFDSVELCGVDPATFGG